MEDTICYYLKLLNFARKEDFSDEALEECLNYVEKGAFAKVYVDDLLQTIDEVPDEILKLAVVRNAPKIIKHADNKTVAVGRKKYKFNNVFNGEEIDKTVLTMLEFLEKRIAVGKDSSVCTFGYSKSGKTTLIRELTQSLKGVQYVLHEIYNNELYVFKHGHKIKVDSYDNDALFSSDDVTTVMDKFSRKYSNGLNEFSSRSHTVLKIVYPHCCITLFDLMGNEKCCNKEQMVESKYINNSLFNVSRFLQSPKYKANKCKLTELLKSARNIILTLMLTDNGVSSCVNHLLQFASILI